MDAIGFPSKCKREIEQKSSHAVQCSAQDANPTKIETTDILRVYQIRQSLSQFTLDDTCGRDNLLPITILHRVLQVGRLEVASICALRNFDVEREE